VRLVLSNVSSGATNAHFLWPSRFIPIAARKISSDEPLEKGCHVGEERARGKEAPLNLMDSSRKVGLRLSRAAASARRGAEKLRRAIEVDDARANARSERARTPVATLKRRLSRAKGSQHRRGQVMSAVHASWIAARDEKQRRRPIDQNSPNVLVLSGARPLRDRQAKAA